jgi:hypothetical protein
MGNRSENLIRKEKKRAHVEKKTDPNFKESDKIHDLDYLKKRFCKGKF